MINVLFLLKGLKKNKRIAKYMYCGGICIQILISAIFHQLFWLCAVWFLSADCWLHTFDHKWINFCISFFFETDCRNLKKTFFHSDSYKGQNLLLTLRSSCVNNTADYCKALLCIQYTCNSTYLCELSMLFIIMCNDEMYMSQNAFLVGVLREKKTQYL